MLTIDSLPAVPTGNDRLHPTGKEAAHSTDSRPFSDILGAEEGLPPVDDRSMAKHSQPPGGGKVLQAGGKELPEQSTPEREAVIVEMASSVTAAQVQEKLPDAEALSIATTEASVESPVELIAATHGSLVAAAVDQAAPVQADRSAQVAIGRSAPLPIDLRSTGLEGLGTLTDGPALDSVSAEVRGTGFPLSPDSRLTLFTAPPGPELEGDQLATRPAANNSAREAGPLVAAAAGAEGDIRPTMQSGIRTNIPFETIEAVGAQEPAQFKPPGTDHATALAGSIAFSGRGVELPAGLKIVAPATITTPLGDPGWSGEITGRINLMVKGGMSEAHLQLSPPELGRLEIKIVTDDDQAKILFTVQNASAREAIEQAMPRLRDMLEQSGLQLAHSAVADHSGSQQRHSGVPNPRADLATAELDQGPKESVQEVLVSASDSVVDYYV